MRSRRSRATLVATVMALAAGTLVVGPAQAEPRASEGFRMGADIAAARGRDIPGLAVNPANPLHLVAADNDLLSGQCDYHVSFDGGVTWTSGHLTAPARFPTPPCQPNPFDSGGYGHTNGSIAFGTGQNVYTTFSVKAGPPQRPENDVVAGEADSILVARSTDGGRTFAPGVVAIQGPPDSQPYYIRPKLAVVPRATGDQIYLSGWGVTIPQVPGHGGAQGGLGVRRAVTTVSNDGGTTWSPVIDASGPGEQVRETAAPVVAGGGNAWVAWRNRDPVVGANQANQVVVARTTDGGATWVRTPVSPASGNGVLFLPSQAVPATTVNPVGGAGGHPEMARDPVTGALYVVYQGFTLYPNPTTGPTAPPIVGDLDIFLQRSTDGGVSWTTPVRVNDDPVAGQLQGTGIAQRQPFITVAPNGRVDVVWHDRRNGYPGSTLVSGGTAHSTATQRGADVYLASSNDRGLSFSPNRRITDRTMNLDVGLEGRVGSSTWYGPSSAAVGSDSLMVALPDSREGNFDNDNSDIYLSKVAMQSTDLLPVRQLGQSSPAAAAVGLSKLAYPGGVESQGASAVTKVVVVNENDPGLALAASVLARDAWGPLLVSPATSLPSEVKAEVKRLAPVGAYLIGGTGALSATVEADVVSAGLPAASVQRLNGATPAETARLIADVLDVRSAAQKTAAVPAFPSVLIVNPASPEAGAAAGLAASRRIPVLFVDQNAIPAATSAALTALAVTKSYVVGGPGAVSSTVMASLPAPTRLAGADLYGTAEAVATEARTQGLPGNVVYVADGASPVDSAMLGAAVARLGGLLLLSPGAGAAYNATLKRLGLDAVTDRVVVQLPLGSGGGYRAVASDGGVFAFGTASFLGSTGGTVLNAPVVGTAETPSGNGYWNVASDGGIFAFGDAGFFGSTGGTKLSKPVVGMTPTPTGKGYWLVASDGGIFAFGDASFFGSTGGTPLSKPVVGMAATPTGKGYWLVASDGGIFAFGDAAFKGSTGGIPLGRPVVGMASTLSGNGYWLVASDGGIFAYGDARFLGSTGGTALVKPVVGMAPTPSGGGYWLVASDGGIFAYGDASFKGSTGGVPLFRPIVGLAA